MRPARARTPSPVRGTGFTLVELVAVLGLLGILAAVSGPRFFARSGFDERLFFDDARAAVRHAHKLAVATGCPVQVTIAANSYGLAQRSACDAGPFAQPVVHPGTGAAGYTNTAPSGISLGADVTPFVFDALGRTRDAGGIPTNVTLTVGARTFRVAGETGFVSFP